eukprot:TRINITY_DN11824_c0_g1_i1.p2 TRINITY_DN11824_c0_g1~~TRINITY_DN11824_c0_g1_i1.p2  ORF type:complete len:144 (-),score=19.16 TRINITY_DN11824_c0_g1_i1:276-707(-)
MSEGKDQLQMLGNVGNDKKCIDHSKEEFPQARIKRIVKSESTDVKSVSLDASYVFSKAAELFLDELVGGAGTKMLEQKRRVLAYKDVASSVNSSKKYQFLEDIVPQKISGSQLFQLLHEHGRATPQQLEQIIRSNKDSTQIQE